jgi:hypothetical protein
MKRVIEFAFFVAFVCGLALYQRLSRTRWVETRAADR